MLKIALASIVAAMILLSAQSLGAKAIDERIYITPAGTVDDKVPGEIKSALPGLLPMSVHLEIGPPEKLAESAYDPARKQYNAQVLINDIAGRNNLVTTRETMLVVADADLYSGDLNFVFGLANPKTKIGIISLTRLNNEFYGLKPNKKLLHERAAKEAMHELGHIWGLPNCSNPKCAMYFSDNLADTDKKKDKFCHDCNKRLRIRYTSALFAMPVF